MSIIQHALEFASEAHKFQSRKYTNEPYIIHPVSVMWIVKEVPHTDAMLCAALLHDTVEDTEVNILDIHNEFGAEIAGLVHQLTDASRPEDGNRVYRKEIDRRWISGASPEAKTIKLADLLDNSASIMKHDPGFAKTYMGEKSLLLNVLREGDSTLWVRASRVVQDYYRGDLQ